MTQQEYNNINDYIYSNGRVESAEDGDDFASYDAEFHFEARERGFSDTEIAEAQERFGNENHQPSIHTHRIGADCPQSSAPLAHDAQLRQPVRS